MGSRIRSSADKILECFLEVSGSRNGDGPAIEFIHPTDFDDKEALSRIPQFCFPCETATDAVQHYTFVLTDIEGTYRFGFCRLSPDVNKCLCVLSYFPWFKIFYELLNTISDIRRGQQSDSVVPFLNLVLQEPPPGPGGKFQVEHEGRELSFAAPDPSKLPSIPEDRNLTDYFSFVDPKNMISIFCSMFFERRIIVTSKKLNLLTACTYGAATLLYPMHWQHMFVPIVPPHLLEYCCAPMPFLVGVHSSLMPRVRTMPLDEVVIFDADTNEMEVPFDDPSTLPSEVISTLKSSLKKPVYPMGDYVSRAFLVAMASLIGSYRDALRLKPGENIIFDRDIFVQSRPSELRPLFESMLQLQLFEQFVTERLELLNAGRGFNDVFEQQIGLQTENQASWKSQYQRWMRKAHKKAKQGIKEAKGGLQDVKQEFKPFMKNVKENFTVAKDNIRKGWKGNKDETDDIPKEAALRKSHSWSDGKQFGLGDRLSPFSNRRSVCPAQLQSDPAASSAKVPPPRPPPPRPGPYSSYKSALRRPRTNAMSMVDVPARSPSPSRHSAPAVGQLISFDAGAPEIEDTSTPSSSDSEGSARLNPGVESDQLGHDECSRKLPEVPDAAGSTPEDQTPVKPPRRRSQDDKTGSSLAGKPEVPARPVTRRAQKPSVDEILESVDAGLPAEVGISPLKHNSFSLLKDTVTSLTPELQEWLTADCSERQEGGKGPQTCATTPGALSDFQENTGNTDFQESTATTDAGLTRVTESLDSVLQVEAAGQSRTGVHANHTPTDAPKTRGHKPSADQGDWVAFD